MSARFMTVVRVAEKAITSYRNTHAVVTMHWVYTLNCGHTRTQSQLGRSGPSEKLKCRVCR